MYAIQSFLPSGSILLKHPIVRGELHGGQRVEVLAALVEEVVPATSIISCRSL
jgi:hypothetical protein